jgi:hypothetical protein
VRDMAWPDSSTVTSLAPTHNTLQFREQLYRERINYRPGEGSKEIYLVPHRYHKYLKTEFQDAGLGYVGLTDAGYAETMAIERLRHVASLLRRLQAARQDKSINRATRMGEPACESLSGYDDAFASHAELRARWLQIGVVEYHRPEAGALGPATTGRCRDALPIAAAHKQLTEKGA